jgi:molybdenum cofactor cytidylyltransferase
MLLHQALRLLLNPSTPDVVAMVGGGGKSSTAFRLAAEVAATGRRAVVAPTTRIAAFQTEWAPEFIEVRGAELPWQALATALDRHGYCLLGGPIAGDRRLGLDAAQVDQLAQRAAEFNIAAITIEADGSKMRPVKAPAEHEPVLPDSVTHLAPVAGMDAIGAAIDAHRVHRPELVRQVVGLSADDESLLTPAMLARLLLSSAGGAKGLRPSMRFSPILNKADTPLRLIYARLTASLLAGQGVASLVTHVGNAERAPVVERWGQVGVVVLAAGGSSRMGDAKQLIAVGDAPMIVRAVRTALRAGVGPVVVVTGAADEATRSALGEWGSAIAIVHNAAWAEGQATSVMTALNALPSSVEVVIFMPVDQPLLDPLLLRRQWSAWRSGADLAAPHVEGEMRGAPALFDRCFWPELQTLRGDVGGRRVLTAHRNKVVMTPARMQWLLDVDTVEDLQALLREAFLAGL